MKHRLKNDLEVQVRDVLLSDAEMLIDYMRKVISETANLMRESDEFKLTVEQEESFIKRVINSENEAMVLVFHNDLLISTAGIHGSGLRRVKHKVEFGISVLKDYHNIGVGTIVMEHVIKKAKELNKKKIELEVRNDNLGAIHLYEKFGFVTEGIKKGGFIVEGELVDLRQMGLFLEDL